MTDTPASQSPSTATQMLAAAAALGMERLDAQLLLLHVLGRPSGDRAWLLAHDTDVQGDTVWARFSALCARRIAGEPVAYLLGEKEFHGLGLQVDARVLVPRPDTETLVDWALQCLEGRTAPSVIDLGTGSGAIALAILHARPDAQVTAVDRSADALAVARANAQRLGLALRFAEADWLEGAGTGLDLVVSNPPYVAAGDPHLAALRHEPPGALVSGPDGLDDIRRIVEVAPAHLREGGWLLLEHGWDQAAAVRGLLEARGFAEVQSRDDLAGIARCSGGILRAVK
ncbi:peptide chain release factor N(5)-glutamine methyltransferase [Variovorax sp. JS1663]|uniref:peptide chain release factor N(5)-glutamine methyltransferase n=1 Tax=Variovorax sp. JS1663 TaxID=1851577 RepID=UPI000B3474C4|nr:peptide chain release factor N(5)-glutamine methyltransferase [Variovorax sp. JS1663]OUM01370.1 protein-(glutamine-N5) methyltransferase, release factor-specific [Variovorax sp. JS1663]